ncbi:alpha/beta fold hydrolase [Sphingomonas oligophenolica]|uniref:Alpha/beta fold hydrolase n=1 Tax=Sphingomonas oligophenolica TaxID=301154 RepID=A0A502CIR3_9SPHN|nr:alpha/beta fold hydrolase [Sphingomonas oligophenolica]TPG12703.1 alpha/beta fold hydrolase [Sphingomonas oligophenolica]
MKVAANGIEIEVESFGADDAPAMLLIMGLGAQLTRWSIPFVEALVARGYRVIRYDNRDVGLSTKFDAAGAPKLARIMGLAMIGVKARVPYTLDDMAADAIGVLDALGIDRAHIVGASMGGMIAQLVAAHYPERTLSLTSIMSTTGNRSLPRATKEATAVLMDRPKTRDRETIIAHAVRAAAVIGSPGYRVEAGELRAKVVRDFERMHYPAGFARQIAAITVGGDRRKRLAAITAPTLVIHGTDDPLVPIAGGRDTAASIPGAVLHEMPGMGHDLPEPLIPTVCDLIDGIARQAEAIR